MNERHLIIEVRSLAQSKARILEAFKGVADVAARYMFTTHEQLLRTLTPGRWKLLETLTGAGPLGLRELARRAERDIKGVHTDAQALVACGLIDRTEDARYSFPFDSVDVHLEVKAAHVA
jgi:predicted transcriptional regulator